MKFLSFQPNDSSRDFLEKTGVPFSEVLLLNNAQDTAGIGVDNTVGKTWRVIPTIFFCKAMEPSDQVLKVPMDLLQEKNGVTGGQRGH